MKIFHKVHFAFVHLCICAFVHLCICAFVRFIENDHMVKFSVI